ARVISVHTGLSCAVLSFVYFPLGHVALHSCPTRRSSDLCAEIVIVDDRSDPAVGGGKFLDGETIGEKARCRAAVFLGDGHAHETDRKSTRLNSSHVSTSYAVFCLKKKTIDDLAPV